MSSCSLSAIESLLRMTVAMPVRVATLPIGSSVAAGAGDAAGAGVAAGAGEGAGVGAGWICASRVGAEAASIASRAGSIGSGDGIAVA